MQPKDHNCIVVSKRWQAIFGLLPLIHWETTYSIYKCRPYQIIGVTNFSGTVGGPFNTKEGKIDAS